MYRIGDRNEIGSVEMIKGLLVAYLCVCVCKYKLLMNIYMGEEWGEVELGEKVGGGGRMDKWGVFLG